VRADITSGCRGPVAHLLGCSKYPVVNSFDSSISISSPRSGAVRRVIITAIALLVGVLLQIGTAWMLKANIDAGFSDFRNFYTAGKIVDQGQGDRLYDRSLQAEVQRTFVAPSLRGDANFLPFIHPPFEVLVYAPLARLPYATAFWILWGCNLLFAYIAVFLIQPQIPILHESFGLVLLALALFKPLLTAEIQGQDSIWMFLLIVLCYLGLVHGRPLLSGFALGLACCKPQQGLLLLLLVLIITSKRWRFVAGSAAAFASLLLASLLAVGWKATIGYPHAVKVFTSLYDEINDHPDAMPNIRGLTLSLLQGRVSHQIITDVIAIISAIILILTIWMLWSRRHSELPIRFALLVTCVLLTGFYEYSHDFTLLLLPVLLIWNVLAREGLHSWDRKILAGSIGLLILGGVVSILLPLVLGCTVLLVWGVLWVQLYRIHLEPDLMPAPVSDPAKIT
jgi:hypothetical protein